ncbi:MAG: plasmid pRiA4b ORF-3 family protein [Myxococcota bacterium]
MGSALQLHVSLRHTDVWRRLQVAQSGTFHDLHLAIQEAFGWRDAHLYAFSRGADYLAFHPSVGASTLHGTKVKLYRHLGRRDLACKYEYDFGDWWVLDVRVEEIGEAKDDILVLEAHKSAPPEGCGGVPGYERLVEFCESGVDPWGEKAEGLRAWIGEWQP